MLEPLPVTQIEGRFRFVRGRWVLPEADLAAIHGVTRDRLLKHLQPYEPWPGEFCFYLDGLELSALDVRSRRDGCPPLAFTEHGALAAACILGSPQAIAQSVHVARTFAQLRQGGMVHEAGSAATPSSPVAISCLPPLSNRRAEWSDYRPRTLEDGRSFQDKMDRGAKASLVSLKA